eukprot:CAMPEP_0197831822 /NCGR_PEP_ID=MMETSP1437-20131217/12275_1 /TAXON_ID=49252 ORGANISM="Eucampia antarctica, Strain CCMP1452" /NCGR_SAMPLE_ID=MMETSP1437 /ASSEMBLY_ACC=CAM_ASM_001096 /LENGTH=312 /DNA_ID=CAMNT_0043434909 /DNA_START=180 /DNA_END=1118 /DNA_ORIENTATION=+
MNKVQCVLSVERKVSFMRSSVLFLAAVLLLSYNHGVFAFQPVLPFLKKSQSYSLLMSETTAEASSSSSSSSMMSSKNSGKGFGEVVKILPKTGNELLETKSPSEIKDKLVDLLLHMTGKEEEFRLVETYVNVLEEKFISPQTLGFFNMAISGDWQFLFTTSVNNRPSSKLRLSELVQKVESDEASPFEGKLITKANWALAEDDTQTFDCYGSFTIECLYKVNQGTRMIIDLDQHLLEPAKGSKIPKDVQGLVGMLHRAIPKEMFDPEGLAIDTTYADPDVRIVRFTGKRHEGVRNIFFKSGSVAFDPSKKEN